MDSEVKPDNLKVLVGGEKVTQQQLVSLQEKKAIEKKQKLSGPPLAIKDQKALKAQSPH